MLELLIASAILTLFYMALYIQLHVNIQPRNDTRWPVAGLPHTSYRVSENPGEKDFTGNVCCYCKCLLQKRFETKEHLVPLSRGGNNTSANLRFACDKCNSDRADKPLHVWARELRYRRLQGLTKKQQVRYNRMRKNCYLLIAYLKENADLVYASLWEQQQNKVF